MKKFLVLYAGNPTEVEKAALTPKDLAPKVAAWGKWVEKNRKSFVEFGAPVGKTKRVDNSGVSDSKNSVGAYVVIEADSYDAAAKMFIDHPHLSFFEGNWIEIMECLPLPKG